MGYRFVFDDTGTFEVTADGREIAWMPGPKFEESWVRADVTGRVMALALHASGYLCLHGSAVATDERRHRVSRARSTTASRRSRSRSVAQERSCSRTTSFPVDPSPPVKAIPGVHQVKLWQDSASHFGVDRDREPPRPGSKHLLHDFDDNMISNERVPLAAVYLLAPVIVEEGAVAPPVSRARLHSVPSALALVRHSIMGSMLTGPDAQRVFDRATVVAETVPVYQLTVAAGMERIGDTVDQLLAWHGEPVAAEARA